MVWQFLLTGTTVLASTALVVVDGRTRGTAADDVHWLRHGPALRVVGLFGVATAIYAVVDNILLARHFAALILGGVFILMGLPLFLLAFFWRVGYDSAGLRCVSPWRRKRFVLWTDMRHVSFSTVMKQWVVHTTASGTIRINVLVPGSRQLMQELVNRRVVFEPTALDALSKM